MKLFEVLSTKQGKGYASVSLDSHSTKLIHDILKELGIESYIPDLHITLVYDRSNPTIDMKLKNSKYNARVIGVDTLGDLSSKWGAIVLKLNSPTITKRHKDYIDAGYTHSYKQFVPHLSLKYRPTNDDINTIKSNFDKFKKLDLVFHNEKLEKIKEY